MSVAEDAGRITGAANPTPSDARDDVLDVLARLEKRFSPVKWLWGIAAGVAIGAFWVGEMYAATKADLAQQTIYATTTRVDLDTERTSRVAAETAMAGVLNKISNNQDLLAQHIRDTENKPLP